VRDFEKKTLYKSNIIWDKSGSLVYRFFMFYNGKIKNGYERIGMAVSADMINWSRYGTEPGVVRVRYAGWCAFQLTLRYGLPSLPHTSITLFRAKIQKMPQSS